MVIAVCVVISYTKWEKIATGIKFFEPIHGSPIVHSWKVDANSCLRLGGRVSLASCTGLCFMITRDIPIGGLVGHLSALPEICFKICVCC